MYLCFDIGNSRIKYAVFNEASEIVYLNNVIKWETEYLEELLGNFSIEAAIIAASGIVPSALLHQIEEKMHLIILDTDTKIPLEILYETPETLGRDRIASVIGGQRLFPGKSLCVITLGTCITYNVSDEKGRFLGGNISPGLDMRLKAMHEFTANLPLVDRGFGKGLIGTSTEDALQKGAGIGTLLEIESFIERVCEKYSEINIILTGGDANYFAEKIKSKIFVNPDLVLIGLNEIIKINA